MDNELEVFAGEVRAARARARLSQEELASMIGVSCQSVSNWENGTSVPTLRVTLRLAEVLGVSLDQLAGRTPAGVGR